MDMFNHMNEATHTDQLNIFRSWSTQRSQPNILVTKGMGSWFWDDQGNKYLDFSSQRVNLNLGHQHPKIINAIKRQADSLTSLAQIFSSEPRSQAAKMIADRTPGELNKILFTNSGTEAVENAVRMARIHTGRNKIFAMYRSYHGSTGGAISLTGDPRRWGSEPGVPGVVRFIGPYAYRSSFNASSEDEECERAINHLQELLMYEGPQNVAAIILEPVVGSNGVLVPPKRYLQHVRKICDSFDIVLICDEVMSGFGRCGEWFAVNRWSVVPDLITFAKGVNSGYVPLGGVAISSTISNTFLDTPYPGGGTYYGHPLACASAVGSIEALEEESIMSRVNLLSEELIRPTLEKICDAHSCVGEARGVGFLWALELVKDKSTKEMLVPFNAPSTESAPMKLLEKECLKRGVSVLTTANRLFICPPLNASEADITLGLAVIDEVLYIIDKLAK